MKTILVIENETQTQTRACWRLSELVKDRNITPGFLTSPFKSTNPTLLRPRFFSVEEDESVAVGF
jgi:hypothetical protein